MGKPVNTEESVSVARPPESVWAVIADYSKDLLWREDLTEMTPEPPGPPAVGTKVREVIKQGNREYVTTATVTDLDPGVSYRFAGPGTIGGITGGRRVVAEGAGATFTYDFAVTLQGFNRLLRPIIARKLWLGLRRDLDNFREKLESGQLEQPSPS